MGHGETFDLVPMPPDPPPRFHERQKIHGADRVILGLLMAIHADLYRLALVDCVERTEQPIPDGKDKAQIPVPMALSDRVMELVMGRRDEKLSPNALVRQPDMRMAQVKAEKVEDHYQNVELEDAE